MVQYNFTVVKFKLQQHLLWNIPTYLPLYVDELKSKFIYCLIFMRNIYYVCSFGDMSDVLQDIKVWKVFLRFIKIFYILYFWTYCNMALWTNAAWLPYRMITIFYQILWINILRQNFENYYWKYQYRLLSYNLW